MPIWEFMIQAKIAGSYTEALEKLADLTGRPIPSSLQKKTRTDEDQAEDIIQEFNQKYAIVSVGSSVRILDESTDAVLFRTEKDFHLLERNRFVRLNDKKIPATKYWLEHPQVRKHKQVVFEPGSTSPEKYNLWKGFAVQPIPGDCSLFQEFVRDIICSGNTEYYKYLMQWMAHAVQSPEIKPGVVIVLQGGQGVGKGFFINTFGHLFGSHYVASAEIENFVGRFNSILMDKLLVFLDECFWGGDRRVASKLKAMITEPSHTIEKKGVDQFSIRNYLRFLIASNDPWVIHAERDERRYFVLEVSDAYQNNRPYFQKIKTQMEEGGYEAFLHHLQTYDLSGFDVGKFPRTPHQLEQKFKSMSVVERFIFERLTEGCLHPDDSYWDGQIEKEKLYTCYCETVKQSGIGKSNWSGEFGKQVLKMIPRIQTKKITSPSGKRCALYLFPPLEECRKSFETYFHAEGMIEWDKGEVMVSPSPNERDEDVSIFFDTTIEEDEEEYSLSFF